MSGWFKSNWYKSSWFRTTVSSVWLTAIVVLGYAIVDPLSRTDVFDYLSEQSSDHANF